MNIKIKNTKAQKNLLLVIVAMYWFSQYVYVPYQTPYLISIGVTAAFAGTIMSAYGLTQMIMRMPVGIMADRKAPHTRFIILGTLSVAAASLFRIFLPNAAGFLIGNLFSGLASAMWISFMVFYSQFFDEDKQHQSVGEIVAVNNFGILIGFIAGTLLYDRMGITTLCILSVTIACLATILAFLLPKPKPRTVYPSVPSLLKGLGNKRLIIFSIIALILQGVIMSTCMSFTSQAAKLIGGTGFEIGLSSIIYVLAAVLSSYFASTSFVVKRGGSFWVPAGLLSLILYCIIIPNAQWLVQIYLAQILAGFSVGILFSFCTSESMKNVPQERKSTAMGFFQTVYALGMTVVPAVMGSFVNKYGMKFAFYSLAVLSIIGLAIALWTYKNIAPGDVV